MNLFPDVPVADVRVASYDIETPLGTVASNVRVNTSAGLPRPTRTYRLTTSGWAASWHLPSCTIELVVTRPALIQEYWDQISDCWAYLWRIHTHEQLDRLEFVGDITMPSPLSGGCDPGQYLAAHTWDDTNYMLSLGTEGEDALYHRAASNDWLPQSYLAEATEWQELPFIEYLPDGLSIVLTNVQAHTTVQAQFVTAWAPYDEESIGTWDAVRLEAIHILHGAKGQRVWA